LWTGPPTEGEDSSLSSSNHSAAGPQARTGLKQFDSLFKTAKNKEDTQTICFIFLQQQKKEDTHRTWTICFIFLQQQKIKRTHRTRTICFIFLQQQKMKRTLTIPFTKISKKLKYGLQNFKKYNFCEPSEMKIRNWSTEFQKLLFCEN